MDDKFLELAKVGYKAYRVKLTHEGQEAPPWEDLPLPMQWAWRSAAKVMRLHLEAHPFECD